LNILNHSANYLKQKRILRHWNSGLRLIERNENIILLIRQNKNGDYFFVHCIPESTPIEKVSSLRLIIIIWIFILMTKEEMELNPGNRFIKEIIPVPIFSGVQTIAGVTV
jgi:hypothetical protein